jgi:hypothetical protein
MLCTACGTTREILATSCGLVYVTGVYELEILHEAKHHRSALMQHELPKTISKSRSFSVSSVVAQRAPGTN